MKEWGFSAHLMFPVRSFEINVGVRPIFPKRMRQKG